MTVAQAPKPQPCFPAWNCAPGPEQMPQGKAQQAEAQSFALRHCPPMNCRPAPLPTFFAPAGSNVGPPTQEPPLVGGGGVAGGGGGLTVAPALKPQPCFPAWNCAPGPEQMPQGKAKQAEAQSFALRHCPPMNWRPAPLPTFFARAGSNVGPPTQEPPTVGGVGGAGCGGGFTAE